MAKNSTFSLSSEFERQKGKSEKANQFIFPFLSEISIQKTFPFTTAVNVTVTGILS